MKTTARTFLGILLASHALVLGAAAGPGDPDALSADVNLQVGWYDTGTQVFTPLDPGETVAQNEIIAVRIVPTTDYYVGAASFVVMFDKTLFTVQGTNKAAFIVNTDTEHIDYDAITNMPGYQGNHYYDFACTGFAGTTTTNGIPDSSWPAGFAAGENFDVYKAIRVTTQADSNSLNEGYPEVLPGTWLFQFRLKANSNIVVGTDARIWMDARWFRSSTNPSVAGYIPKCLAGELVANAKITYAFDFDFSEADIELALPTGTDTSTITFDSAGGSAVAPITQDEGTAVAAPADPTRAGHTFNGWVPEVPATMPMDDLTCVAQWTAQSTITFDTAGGSAVAPITQDEGTAVAAPADPTRAGHTFNGWVPAIPEYMPEDDLTCVAQWEEIIVPTSTISFDSAGGTPIAPITQDEGAPVPAPADPTRAGYTFTGWDPAVPATMPVDDLECVAQWSINTYTITFDSMGGTPVAPITQEFGTAVAAPADPTRAGYTFTGWDTSIPATMPSANLFIYAQWQAESKLPAQVYLQNLAQTYDGTARTASATTFPAGLTVEFTYDGNAWAPTNAGSYAVTGTVNDANYAGSAGDTLVVGKASATVTLESLSQTYDGTPKSATATTVPAGLTVDFTYDGSGTAPTAAGSYAVTGTVNEVNYEGSSADTLVIGQAAATVYLGDLAQTYDGTARTITATTMPAGLTVEFTYDGNAWAPTNVGTYAVTGTVNDANYDGSAGDTLVVGKAAAGVYLGDLAQTYDGTARTITATTMPAGLTVEFTYDGNAWAPTNAGSYAVTGTVNDANYAGSAGDTLVVGKASATVTLESLSQTYDGTPKSATATTVPAGLTVDFTYDGSGTAPTAAGSYAVTGTVNEVNYEGSSADTLVIGQAAATVYLGGLAQTYDGTARTVTATTMPAGLTVEFTYDGNAWAPTNAGTYAVTGTVNDANYAGSAGDTLVVGKASATVTLESLSQTYDGTPKSATATTVPAGLTVDFTYDGSGTAPTAAGSYAVTGTVNEVNYEGSSADTLVIGQAAATVYLGDLAQTYDGTARTVTATTMPAGLVVEFTYDGNDWAPTNVGSYAVTGTVNEANWQGSSTGTLVVGKATAEVFLQDLAQTYDGTARTVTATTMPAGLVVEFTYDGNDWAPTNAGMYAVTGTVNEANWQGSSTGTLTVGKAAATVTLESLSHTYDGTPKSATATTAPAGLTVEFTYDGLATAPTAAGSYAVTGTVNEANWQGSSTGTLTVGKAAATVTLESLSQTYDGTPKSATATTDPVGLTVEFTYDGSATAPTAAGNYAVTGTVNEANWQGSATGTLTIGKAAATVELGSLNHVYDGTPKEATATTDPVGLTVGLTYNGSAAAPVNPGAYAVIGTVNDAEWQGTAAGTLVIRPMAGDAYEADDTRAAAKAIANGQVQARNIHAAGNEDWAKFTVEGLGARNVQVETAGAAGDTQLWLQDPAGAQIAYDDNSGTGSFSRITVATLVPGIYAIRVREYNNDGWIPAYTLRAAWTPVPIPADAYEDDDKSPRAKTIANGREQARTIHAAGNYDWARFTVGRRGARNLVAETAGDSGDTQLWIYKSNRYGNAGGQLAYDDNHGVGRFSRIALSALEPGTYFLKVQEYGNNGTIPAYLLRIRWTTP